MRWGSLVVFTVLVTATCADPEPKKYKPDIKDKNSNLTDDEKNFLREVEAKFGVKSDVPKEKKDDTETKGEAIPLNITPNFPAVIAIEIVNDTDTSTKGKRTIDANLGYGYRTNTGYTYNYFGKSSQDKGKFMIYPYSQHDIPPARSHYHSESDGKYTTPTPDVEIQPSQAYELVPIKEEQPQSPYHGNVKSVESPPPPTHQETVQQGSPQSILYTTYNGQQFTGISGQFPKVMSNYFVEANQLLKNPHYQSVGLTSDHLRPHGPQLEQRVVPVLVLRVPSSYLKNPSAELYANLPKNYPLSQHLNNLNLQQLVNQYFQKIGFPQAPQIMAYQNSVLNASPLEATQSTPASPHEPQQYAHPYVQPSYTQAHYSGVQYEAVQPVMARYPSLSTYNHQQYFLPDTPYQQSHQPQYHYKYQYTQQPKALPENYYAQPQYQQAYEHPSQQHVAGSPEVPSQNAQVEYSTGQQASEEFTPVVEYGQPQASPETHYVSQAEYDQQQKTMATEYEQPKEETVEYAKPSQEYGPTKLSASHSQQETQAHYGAPQESPPQEYYSQYSVPKETIAVYPGSQTVQHTASNDGGSQSYLYQKQVNENSGSDTLVISENYPSKDHTHVTVLPLSYKSRNQDTPSIQTVSYVTPVPHTSKYQSHFKIMVPQTVLKGPEKISYVNSHAFHQSQQAQSPETDYTVPVHYVPTIGKQRAPSYPRNYHSHPKRMAKPDNKPTETHSSQARKQKHDKNNSKKSS